MGLIDSAMSGLSAGLTTAGAGIFDQFRSQVEQDRQEALMRVKQGIDRENTVFQAQTNLEYGPKQKAAEASAVAPIQIATHKELGAIDSQQKVDEFIKLEPLKRQAVIDAATGQLKALSTPEMLKAEKQIAQAKHIIDPAYTLIPNADGTINTFDTHSGKTTGTVNGADGKPIIRKDQEELKAAISVINMAQANLRVAEAAYKATISDPTADPTAKAKSEAEWKNAQTDAKRMTAPAYAVLYSKADIETKATPQGTPDLNKYMKPSTQSSTISPAQPVTGLIGNAAAGSGAQSFNEAGYASTQSTIEGAKRGDQKALSMLRSMLDEGGLTASERAQINALIK